MIYYALSILLSVSMYGSAHLDHWLLPTNILDINHSSIKECAARVCKDCESKQDKAVALHDFVRDEILFGFAPALYNCKASGVLAAKVGYCNTKSTLLVALLRHVGIPARIRVYSLSSKILDGLISVNTKYVDHSVTECFINGVWIPFDSYVIDSLLYKVVSKKLAAPLGLGIHGKTMLNWNGKDESFSQYNVNYIKKEWGVYSDIGEFYRSEKSANNKLSLLTKIALYLSHNSLNKNIQELRKSQI